MTRNRPFMWLLCAGVALLCMGQDCVLNVNVDAEFDTSGDPEGPVGFDPPVFINVSADLVVDCSSIDIDQALNVWLNSPRAVADDGCGPVTVTSDFEGLSDTCDGNGWVTTVIWKASDRCGLTAQISATLTLVNPDPPVIELNGEDAVILPTHVGTYIELGAVASIGCGLEQIEATVGGDVVDVDTPGTYIVTYDAVDPCGNAAEQVTRNVFVVDPPEFVVVPEDLMVDCSDEDAEDILAEWLGSAEAEADDICGDVTISHAIMGLADDCTDDGWTLDVEWTAEDECGLTNTASATLTLLDPAPAVIELIGEDELTLECHIDEYVELGAVVSLGCAGLEMPATVGGDDVDVDTPGTYVVTYSLSDECGHATEELTRTVTVVDTLPPVVILKDPVELWSPNHKYQTLQLSDCVESVKDACEGDLDVDEAGVILSIYSDESENATGDGNTEADIIIVDTSSFMLRVERQGGGNGRVYGITFEVTDSEGNSAVETCRVMVPHDQSGQGAVDDGPAYTVVP